MNKTRYRSGETSLTNDELLLLDVVFWIDATPAHLRRHGFEARWNSEPHALDDGSLLATLSQLQRDRVLIQTSQEFRGQKYLSMTKEGGELWSLERRPIWDRYCSERYKITTRGRTLMSVAAVNAEIRDDFLDWWPYGSARRRKAVRRDTGLIKWRRFGMLHIGLAIYEDPCMAPEGEYQKHIECEEHDSRIETRRTWWRSVDELQRFVGVTPGHTGE